MRRSISALLSAMLLAGLCRSTLSRTLPSPSTIVSVTEDVAQPITLAATGAGSVRPAWWTGRCTAR